MLNWHPLHSAFRNLVISGRDHLIFLFKIEDLGINLCKGLLDISQTHKQSVKNTVHASGACVSMLGKNFSSQLFEIFFLFSQKRSFDISCQSLLSEENKKNNINLSSAEFA